VNPALLLQQLAKKQPTALALAFENQRYTWRQMNARANQYAAFFKKQGVRSGDVVALMMDNRPDYLFCVMGLNRIGAITSLINTNLKGDALEHALQACGSTRLFLGTEHIPTFEDSPCAKNSDLKVWLHAPAGQETSQDCVNKSIDGCSPRTTDYRYTPRGEDVYCYIYTSGTTGLPKAAVIRNQRMLGANVFFGHLVHQSTPGSLIYVPLPLYHSNAMLLGFGSSLATGAAIGLRQKFSASGFWPDVQNFRATSFVYIGELCRYLLNTPSVPQERGHELQVAVGNGLRPDIWEEFQERFEIPTIREFYGSTEGNAPAINFSGKPGMIGRLAPSMVVVQCDPTSGEIHRDARGHAKAVNAGESGLLLGKISKLTTFEGYVDKKATAKKLEHDLFKSGDRYFNTGDLVKLHEGRWLSFEDRLGDTFRWKGENVSTTQVAETLNGAQGVLESNVYGVAVEKTEGKAGMVALTTNDDFDIKKFAHFVKDELAAYQRPVFVRIIQGGMRVTGTFKHQKTDYRKEGFNPKLVQDPLYYLSAGNYLPVDAKAYKAIHQGEESI
jgi:fatty-acyl-CoA synthase